MAKRDAHYEGMSYDTTYPTQEEMVKAVCDVCGAEFVVNNWEDKKSRTPRFKRLVVCPECDPRHPEDRYMKEGYRILHPRRLHIIRLAQVTRAMSFAPCKKPGTKDCKCVPCVAGRLMPPF